MKFVKVFLMVTLTMTMLVGCTVNGTDKIYDDESKIVKEGDSFGLVDSKETIEDKKYIGDIGLTGTGTIWKYKVEEDSELEIKYDFSVESEKGKLVFVSGNKELTTIAELKENSEAIKNQTTKIQLKKGENRIKIVGNKNARIKCNLEIEEGKFYTIDFDL